MATDPFWREKRGRVKATFDVDVDVAFFFVRIGKECEEG